MPNVRYQRKGEEGKHVHTTLSIRTLAMLEIYQATEARGFFFCVCEPCHDPGFCGRVIIRSRRQTSQKFDSPIVHLISLSATVVVLIVLSDQPFLLEEDETDLSNVLGRSRYKR
jgi:hypothetical protein